MNESTTKARFLETLHADRAQWDTLLEEVGKDRMTQQGVVGEWSIKDIIAHVSWHEIEMIGVIKARKLVGSDWWNLPTDQRNQHIFEANCDRPLPASRMRDVAVTRTRARSGVCACILMRWLVV